MSIRIINMRHKMIIQPDEVLVKVDRSSPLGNPFPMHSERERDLVCDKYEIYFKKQITIAKAKRLPYTDFIVELKRIYDLIICDNKNVVLACWCAPKRCHAETIKRFIEIQIEKHNQKYGITKGVN